MQYHTIEKATFITRPNRFIAHVERNGSEEIVHVKNTGRCKELLLPGATVYLEKSQNPERKTGFSLIAVQKGDLLINMDSQAPNQVVYEAVVAGKIPLLKHFKTVKREYTYGNSRFDLYVERAGAAPCLVEVKGVTLEDRGVVLFPDAPTERGAKHVRELTEALSHGYDSVILFLIQMERCRYFTPNYKTDPAFCTALTDAYAKGVSVLAYACNVTPDTISLSHSVAVCL